jgi:ribose 5-phosphate isomerase A
MQAKQAAANKAMEAVQSGMVVGLGSGSTSFFAIEKLGAMVRNGLQVKAVGSSLPTEELARKAGITIVDIGEISSVDLYVDGADEVDQHFNLIKGGGGALVREKIVAFNSKVFVVIVDASKLVKSLGRFPLPVEVVPFAANLTLRHLQTLGGKAVLRQRDGKPFISDNGNVIVDVQFGDIKDPVALNAVINVLPGVVESGLFDGRRVHRVLVGHEDGHVDELKR